MCVCVYVCIYTYIHTPTCVCVYVFMYIHVHTHTVQLGYNVMKETGYFVSLLTRAIITENYNIMVNRSELIGTTEYLTL